MDRSCHHPFSPCPFTAGAEAEVTLDVDWKHKTTTEFYEQATGQQNNKYLYSQCSCHSWIMWFVFTFEDGGVLSGLESAMVAR